MYLLFSYYKGKFKVKGSDITIHIRQEKSIPTPLLSLNQVGGKYQLEQQPHCNLKKEKNTSKK